MDSLANWNQVCNSGLGLGALAIGEEAPDEAGEVLHSILWSLPASLRHLGPDGGTNEGPSYWEYGLSYTTILLAALQSALGEDFGLSRTPGLERTGFFPLYMTGPTGRAFNFSDGSDELAGIPGLFWLAQQFNQPALAAYRWQHLAERQSRASRASQLASLAALDLLWASRLLDSHSAKAEAVAATTPITAARPPAISPPTDNPPTETPAGARGSLPLGAYFRNTEVFTWRSAWEQPDALFFALRAGDNAGAHSHLDAGSFVLEALGQRWAINLGGENYNVLGYFGPQRRDYYRVRAEGHNTLVLSPGSGPDQQPVTTRIVRHNVTPTDAYAIVDLTPAYAPLATRVQRGITTVTNKTVPLAASLPTPDAVVIQDEITAPQAVDLWWFLHTLARIKLNGTKRSALLVQGGEQLLVRIVEPPTATFEVLRAEPLPVSAHPERQSPNPFVSKLAIHLPNTTSQRLVVVLAPVIHAPALPDVQLKVKPLAEW